MYGHVYVARVAFGAKMAQTVQAFVEAESYRRAVADHRLQPLHRARLRHGAGRGAAEAGRRFRRLAALPLRSAPDSAGRAAAASGLRSAEGEGGRLHAQRVALPDGRARRSGALQDVRRAVTGGAERRYSVYQQLAGITVPAFESRRRSPTSADDQGEVMDLSTTYLGNAPAASAGRRRRTARRRARHGQGARRRRRGNAVLRSLFEEEIVREQMDAFFNLEATTSPSAKPVRSRRNREMSLGARRVSQAPAPGQRGGSASR